MDAVKTMSAEAMAAEAAPAISRAPRDESESRATVANPMNSPSLTVSTSRPMPGELIGYASIAGIAALTLLRVTGLL